MKRRARGWGIFLLCLVILCFCVIFQPFKFKPFRVVKPKPHVKLGLDLAGGSRLVLRCRPTKDVPEIGWTEANSVKEILRRRVDAFGLAEVPLYVEGKDRIVVELAGIKPEKALEIVKTTALLEWKYIPDKYVPEVERRGGKEIVSYSDKRTREEVPEKKVLTEAETIVTGRDLKNARPGYAREGGPAVDFELKKAGSRKFARFTRTHVGKILAIVLDGHTISAPKVREPITGGRGQISGGFETVEEAADLAKLLEAGALPVPLDIMENRSVSPTLGLDSVNKCVKAGIIGFIVVILFMLFYYRLPGLLADFALLIYGLLLLGVLVMFGATLTLPSIAAFILSLGMAVDANIIIFERMKEELRWGKTLLSAIDAGFGRALPAIVDSQVTTLLAALALWWFGTGPIKGFAVTLFVGTGASMFTAIIVTRLFLYWVVNSGLGRDIKYYRR